MRTKLGLLFSALTILSIFVFSSTSKAAPFPTYEAESGILDYPVGFDNQASGGQYVYALPGTGSYKDTPGPRIARYSFNLDSAGKYYFRGRVSSRNDEHNSFWVQIDNNTPFMFRDKEKQAAWHWFTETRDNTGNLSVGNHTLTLYCREDDTWLDQWTLIQAGGNSGGGNEPSEPPDPSDPSGNWNEAESGILDYPVGFDNQASGGQYVYAPPGTGSYKDTPGPRIARYSFNLDSAGKYYFRGRVSSRNGEHNSFWVQIDNNTPFMFRDKEKQAAWHWFTETRDNTGNLSAGNHTLTLYCREDDTWLDQWTLISAGGDSGGGVGDKPKATDEWIARRIALEKVHIPHAYYGGRIRIWYTLTGPDALPYEKRSDINGNGTPDFIEDIALQFKAADSIFLYAFDLRSPLESPRYKDRCWYIDVFMLAQSPNTGQGQGWNGTAYDSIKDFGGEWDGTIPPRRSLAIDIWNNLPHGYLTPTHELFHLYQYGYTQYRNEWFIEGMARWAETVVGQGKGRNDYLQQYPDPWTTDGQRVLFNLSYDAVDYWTWSGWSWGRVLGILVDTFPIPWIIKCPWSLYTDGTCLYEDNEAYGLYYIKDVLEALDRKDDLDSEREGLDPNDWPEDRQKDERNNDKIYRASIGVWEPGEE
jgi:hypothetical protein